MKGREIITKEYILKYVSQEDIYKLVFDDNINFDEYFISPIREDSNPGCFFEEYNGKLRYVDFGDSRYEKGIKHSNMDCFDFIQIYFNLPNHLETLYFINRVLIKGKNLSERQIIKPRIKSKENKTLITFKKRVFLGRDKRYWKQYGITKDNLESDKVFAISTYSLYNTKSGDYLNRQASNLHYAYTDFNKTVKLYAPYSKNMKFLTNCTTNDIGQINDLPDKGDLLIISKSYKDCRVLRNQGYNSIWFQNEGMIPSDILLINLCNRFKEIIVFFDNDKAGITASIKVREKINLFFPNKAINLYIDPELNNKYNVTDPADMYKVLGEKYLIEFLKNNL